jgi:TetR/AcrR family transcriptional regulator, fatty acid metabolism regulator protein
MRSKNNASSQPAPTFIETARRAQIIESAIETIATLGFAKASLAQIAKHAGISKGVILYHFAGKEELIRQVVEQVFTEGAHFMQAQIEQQTSAMAMLRTYIESNLAFMRAYSRHILALVEIIPNFRTKDGALVYGTADNEPVIAPLEALLRWGQEQGEFRDFSARVMALTIRGAIDVVPGHMAVNPNLDLESHARELVTLFDHATRKV